MSAIISQQTVSPKVWAKATSLVADGRVERLDDVHWSVEGSTGMHRVTLDHGLWACTCERFRRSGGVCSHAVAAYYASQQEEAK